DYAPAYIGLAQTLAHLGVVGWLPPQQVFPAARAAATKALALDETLADAHAVLGMVKLAFEWDWSGTEDIVNYALKIDPHSVVAHDVFSFYLTLLGQNDHGLAHLKHNLDMYPSSYYHNLRLGWCYYEARKYDEAIVQFRKTQEIYPELNLTHIFLAWVYTKKGLYDEALAECAKAQAKGVFDWQCGRIYAEAGKIQEAQNALHALLSQNIPAYAWIAEIYLALGDHDHAFEYFEKAYENGSPEIVQLKVAPQWDALRSDPRYFALMKKIGLEE
ncbi:MAG: tetratricopeptide repeat protein, partial [bacterium]